MTIDVTIDQDAFDSDLDSLVRYTTLLSGGRSRMPIDLEHSDDVRKAEIGLRGTIELAQRMLDRLNT